MDENEEIVQNFQLLLQEQSLNKPLQLYKAIKTDNSTVLKSNRTLTANYVLTSVDKQIKAMHSADCAKTDKKSSINLCKCKKSTFLPVNMLSKQDEPPPQRPVFDCQCSDTQLVDIVQNVEQNTLNVNYGLTQEFETSFFQRHVEECPNEKSSRHEPIFPILDISLKEPDLNTSFNIIASPNDVDFNNDDNDHFGNVNVKTEDVDNCVIKIDERVHNLSVVDVDDQIDKEMEEIDKGIVKNKANVGLEYNNIKTQLGDCTYLKSRNQLDNLSHESAPKKPSSPVFNIKSNRSHVCPRSPLVFNLDKFENFEKIALPVIEETTNNDFAKMIINSQISGKELVISSRTDPILKDDKVRSPIIGPSNDILVDKDVLSESSQIYISNDRNVSNNERTKSTKVNTLKEDSVSDKVLEDEILFSSDEEADSLPKSHQEHEDLPFTCALETSFYNQSNVLDTTMYVGFQTASDKSILVHTDSFSKAKIILDDIEEDLKIGATLTQMVKNYDNIHSAKVENTDDFDNNEHIADVVEENPALSPNINEQSVLKPTAEDKQSAMEVCSNEVKLSDWSNDVKDNDKSKEQLLDTLDHEKIDDEIIKEFEDDSEFVEKMRNITNTDGVDKFQISNNNDIEMSYSSNVTSKNFLERTDFKKILNSAIVKTNYNLITIDSNKMATDIEPKCNEFGFKTASNKNIVLSEKGLSRVKHVFSDIEFDNDIEITNKSDINVGNNKIAKTEMNSAVGDYCNAPSTSKGFACFKTANNKEIKISKQALQKSENIFQDIDNLTNISNKLEGKPFEFTGFKTASNKKVAISAKAKTKARKIFENIDKECNNEKQNSDISIKATFSAFKTASNKQINITAEALAENKAIFDDKEMDNAQSVFNEIKEDTTKNYHYPDFAEELAIDDVSNDSTEPPFHGFEHVEQDVALFEEVLAKSQKIFEKLGEKSIDKIGVQSKDGFKNENDFIFQTTNNNLESDRSRVDDTNFKGFQTASNKLIKVSDKALAISKKMFQDVDEKIESESEILNQQPVFKGFQTASNKPVTVSKEALVKSKEILQDINKDLDLKLKYIEHEAQNIFTGFQTASNTKVTIPANAIAKSKKVLQDVDKDEKDMDLKEQGIETTGRKTVFKGFQTANNKPVSISDHALAKSKKLFQDIDINQEMEHQNRDKKDMNFMGFRTASRKQIKISTEALVKSKKIFQDLDLQNDIEVEKEPVFSGFQTASRKEVRISEQALAKSRKILDDIDKEQGSKGKDSFSFKGFKTASNKEVKTSEEALARSKKMFLEVDEEFKERKSSFTGFHTASNKEIKISDEALAKSKSVFKEIDSCIGLDTEMMTHKGLQFGFTTANDNKVPICKESLKKSRKLLEDFNKAVDSEPIKISDDKPPNFEFKHNENLNNIIDTQVLNNFEESLYTEDFLKDTTPMKSKRSGSPILSCPKAKKRKVFQIPYNQKVKQVKVDLSPAKPIQKPTISFDSNYKKTKLYTLKDLEEMEVSLASKTNTIDPYIVNFSYENLLEFEFSGSRNDLKTIPKTTLTTTDVKALFLNSVNKKLVPDVWIDIHLKLILWKLISYEIKFPKTMANICTAQHVIDQLKYRYDKELYNAERPALRKILERDDTSMRMLVLCVVDVIFSAESGTTPELVLTDGWYCIRAIIDKMLSKLVQDEKIVVGTKLVTHGAELVCGGQAVSPWEDTSSIRLKLSGNSTRRARWHTRLGYRTNAAILSHLSSVQQDGGKISKLRVYVTRVYPALYLHKFPDGSTVTRSERLESIYQVKYESERQALLEKIYEEVQTEMNEQDTQDSEDTIGSGKRKYSDNESQVAKVMRRSTDQDEFRTYLTFTQTALSNHKTDQQREKLIQKIQNKVQNKMAEAGLDVCRNVVTLLKVRVVDIEEKMGKQGIGVSKALLSIWKPSDAILEMVKEGAWIEVLNVVPTAVRYSEIQLSAGRQSAFSQSNEESEKIKPYLMSLKRTCYPIKDLTEHPTKTTDYNEIDTAGIVIQIDPTLSDFDSNKHQFQNVYLADSNKNTICVIFWGGINKFGFENVLDTGQIVAGTNLQKRIGNTRKKLLQYRVTEFSYFTKTPKNDTARQIIENLSKFIVKIDKKKYFEDCICLISNCALKQTTNENMSPYRFPQIDANSSKNKIFIDSPLAQKNNKIDDNLNLTGLDFESTFKQTETQEMSPKTLLRKKQVEQKIAKLKTYGEPPPLSPMQIWNKSKNAGKAYKSPLILKSDVSSVASEKEMEEISCSPVIGLNKTYSVKQNVNPVKLNFSINNATNDSLSEVVDDFAEDLSGSPPLSLD